MGFFRKDPKEAAYVGGEKHWAEVIENVGYGGDMITLHPDQDFNTNSTLIVHPGSRRCLRRTERYSRCSTRDVISCRRRTTLSSAA